MRKRTLDIGCGDNKVTGAIAASYFAFVKYAKVWELTEDINK